MLHKHKGVALRQGMLSLLLKILFMFTALLKHQCSQTPLLPMGVSKAFLNTILYKCQYGM